MIERRHDGFGHVVGNDVAPFAAGDSAGGCAATIGGGRIEGGRGAGGGVKV
jgi:hypothetical protein